MINIGHVYKHFPNWLSTDYWYRDTYGRLIFLEDCIIATNTHQIVIADCLSGNVPHLEDANGGEVAITPEAKLKIFQPGSSYFLKMSDLKTVIYSSTIDSKYFTSILKTLRAMKNFTSKRLEHMGVLYSQGSSRLNYFLSKGSISATAHLINQTTPLFEPESWSWAATVNYDFLINAFVLLKDIGEDSVCLRVGYKDNTFEYPYVLLETTGLRMLTTSAQGYVRGELSTYFENAVGYRLTERRAIK